VEERSKLFQRQWTRAQIRVVALRLCLCLWVCVKLLAFSSDNGHKHSNTHSHTYRQTTIITCMCLCLASVRVSFSSPVSHDPGLLLKLDTFGGQYKAQPFKIYTKHVAADVGYNCTHSVYLRVCVCLCVLCIYVLCTCIHT